MAKKDGLYSDGINWYYVKNKKVEAQGTEIFPIEEGIVTTEKDSNGRKKKWTEIIINQITEEETRKREDDYFYNHNSSDLIEIDMKWYEKKGESWDLKKHEKTK